MGLIDGLHNIGDAIREKNGTTDLIPFKDMPQAIRDIAGGGTENMDKFWDTYQDNGNRVDYSCAFAGIGWNNETFNPKYDIKPTNIYMFFATSRISGDLVEILDNLGVVLDTSKAKSTAYMFQASLFTRIGTVDVTASTNSVQTESMCRNCANLVRFEKLVVNEKTKFATNTFNGCSALEYIGFEGAISNSLYLQYSPLLNADCVQGIIDHLATVTTTQTLTLNKSAFENDFDRLTATQRDVITNQKGWTLAFA